MGRRNTADARFNFVAHPSPWTWLSTFCHVQSAPYADDTVTTSDANSSASNTGYGVPASPPRVGGYRSVQLCTSGCLTTSSTGLNDIGRHPNWALPDTTLCHKRGSILLTLRMPYAVSCFRGYKPSVFASDSQTLMTNKLNRIRRYRFSPHKSIQPSVSTQI